MSVYKLCSDLRVLQNCLREEHMWGSQWRKAAHHTRKLAEPSRNLISGTIQAVSSFTLCQASCTLPAGRMLASWIPASESQQCMV